MKFSFSASVEKFDKAKYKAAVDAAVKKAFIKALQKFLLAAVPRIPIWTGMLRGAFRNIEDIAGKVTADAQSSGVRIRTTRSKGQKRGGGGRDTAAHRAYYYPPSGGRVLRTPEAGRQFATPSKDIMEVTGASLATGRTAYYLKFEVDISYFDLLDEKRGWNAWKLGTAAAEAYVKENLDLPNPLEFTTRKLIKSS
jgi:hypothetical protein